MDVRRRNGLHPSSDVWDDDGVRHPDSDDDDCNGKGGAYDFDEAQVSHSSSYKPKHVDVVGGTKTGSHALHGHPAASPGGLNAYTRCIPWILLAVSAFTRFYRLDEPRGNVFDESHFGRFTNQYNDRQFLFDIHPPLGKLVFYMTSTWVGYDWRECEFAPKDPRELYRPGCKYIFVRATAAFFGSWLPVMMYWVCRNWNASIPASLFGAALVLFDMLNVTEARFILVDSQLIFWVAAALLIAQNWWRRQNEHVLATEAFASAHGREYNGGTEDYELAGRDARLMTPMWRFLWCCACGFVFANAFSVKWTGLATPAMIGLESLMGLFFLRRSVPWLDLVRVGVVALLTYAHWFWWHFRIGIKAADGDAFMPYEFQKTIIGNPHYDPAAPKPYFWPSFFYLNKEMLRANAGITQRHPWESVWWEWIFNLRGILYYSYDKQLTYTQGVYLLGNPFVIWPVIANIAFVAVAAFAFMRLRNDAKSHVTGLQPFFTKAAFCIGTYFWSIFPYVFVKRSCYIYHYIPALFYGEILLALTLDKLAGPRYVGKVATVATLIVFMTFLFFSPLVYGIALTNDGHERRRWLPRWN